MPVKNSRGKFMRAILFTKAPINIHTRKQQRRRRRRQREQQKKKKKRARHINIVRDKLLYKRFRNRRRYDYS